MQLSDFLYELPNELCARYPLSERSASRLLCLDQETITHRYFTDIIDLIQPNDLIICNNSKVIPARLHGKKPTGGQVEILIERILNPQTVLAHVRASKSPKLGSYIHVAEHSFEVIKRHDNLFELKTLNNIFDIIDQLGEIPLPHYFNRAPEAIDQERYQTIFAKHKGSVAAPTAGLHFDEKIFQALHQKSVQVDYVTLHVGAGTFAPVRVNDIQHHKMHAEFVEVSRSLCEKIRTTKESGGNIIAVGTTAVRSLETACLSGEIKPFSGDTQIFIYPGFPFKCVDALITNFHLPGSTLLMLVAAFGGYDAVMHAYQTAIQQRYRFFSYGDAMFLKRNFFKSFGSSCNSNF